MKKLLLTFAATVVLAACGQKSTPVQEEAAAPPPAAEAGEQTSAPTTAELDEAATAAQETTAPAQPAAPADSSLERMVAMPEAAQLPGGRWTAGKNYRPLSPSQPTAVAPGEVEVIEFMWLACGGCYQLNERVEAWAAKLPSYVKFRQEHVMWGPSHRALGKLLYTLEALGRHDLISKAFEEIHRKRNMLVSANDAQTQAMQLEFAKANGISEADWKREFAGFGVNTRLTRAEELTRRYRVESTPTFVVNGKYVTDVEMAGGAANLMQLLSDLAAAEKR